MNPLHHVDRVGCELAEEVGDAGLDMLIEKYVETNPQGRGIAESWTIENSVSVWAIIGQIQWSEGDLRDAADAYRMSLDSVRGALAFYMRNRGMIRAYIAINNDDPSYVEIMA